MLVPTSVWSCVHMMFGVCTCVCVYKMCVCVCVCGGEGGSWRVYVRMCVCVCDGELMHQSREIWACTVGPQSYHTLASYPGFPHPDFIWHAMCHAQQFLRSEDIPAHCVSLVFINSLWHCIFMCTA